MEIKAKVGSDGKPIKGTFEITEPQIIQEGQVIKTLVEIEIRMKQLEAQKNHLLEIKNEMDKLLAKEA